MIEKVMAESRPLSPLGKNGIIDQNRAQQIKIMHQTPTSPLHEGPRLKERLLDDKTVFI